MTWIGRFCVMTLIAAALVSCGRSGETPGGAGAMGESGKTERSRALEKNAQHFLELLVKRDYSAAVRDFDPTMKRAMPVSTLKSAWESIIAQAGGFEKRLGVRTEKVGGFDTVFVTVQFEKAVLDMKVVYDTQGRISGLWFVPAREGASASYEPPDYVKPGEFREREVSIGAGEWMLPGTLTIPKRGGEVPGLVLVHGSGPHDRDETIGPNKPFRDLAQGLASRGVAVLRYEKRTKAHPSEAAALENRLTVKEEVVDDAAAAVSLLRRTKEVNSKRVFVLGHSLGGTLIPRIAQACSGAAGFVVMGGSARPLEDVLLEQVTYIASLDGTFSEAEEQHLEQLKEQAARVKSPELSAATPPDRLPLGVPAAYWLDLRGYDPAEAAKRVKRPMLILQGGRDYQVTAADYEKWRKALSARKDVGFRLYKHLNHLFMPGQGKGTPAEYEQPGHVSETVIADIAAWIGSSP